MVLSVVAAGVVATVVATVVGGSVATTVVAAALSVSSCNEPLDIHSGLALAKNSEIINDGWHKSHHPYLAWEWSGLRHVLKGRWAAFKKRPLSIG